MKTHSINKALTCACIAVLAVLLPFSAQGAETATPTEQTSEQTQTLYASQSTFYRELEAFRSFMPIMEISKRVNQKVEEEPTRLSIGLSWAKEKTEVKNSAKVNALYFMIYIDLAAKSAQTVPKKSQYHSNFLKSAYQALLTFEVMLTADAVRCVNPSAKAAIDPLLSQRFQMLQHVADNATPAEMEDYWETALAHEAAAVKRPGNGELCSNKVAAELALQAGKQPPEIVDETIVDDAKWQLLREQVRAKLLEEWKKDYAPIAKALEQRKAQQEEMRVKEEAYNKAQMQAAEEQKKLKAKQAAEAAEKKRLEDEKLALEKKERAEKAKREASKYHDTYTPDSTVYPSDDSSYTPYNSEN